MAFNIEAFKKPQQPMATTYEVCPEGEYAFMIDSDPKQVADTSDEDATRVGVKRKQGVSEAGKAYDFTTWTLSCPCMDEGVKKKLNRESVSVEMNINLDLDEAGNLATGPNLNVKLGQLRDALRQNDANWTPDKVLGAGPFIGRVAHRSSKKNPEIKFAEIVRVAPIR